MQTYTPISRFRPTLLAIIANCAPYSLQGAYRSRPTAVRLLLVRVASRCMEAASGSMLTTLPG